MKYIKSTYLAFFITAFISLLVALFFEKINLLFVYPLTFVSIFVLYMTEKKGPISILYVLVLIFGLSSGVYLIIGFGQYVPEVSILVSIFYLIYLRLMYLKNEKMNTTIKMYLKLLIIFLPILYIYYRVICLIYPEIKEDYVYFAIMVLLMLIYLMAALYYYIRNKNQSNLWMLIVAANLGIMNIIITINELYMYETIFTVIAIFCNHFVLYFSFKFMLEDEKNTLTDIV
ncbi:hypothetical protein [Kordia sp.]|uniref:hypothetical protein n=1 Tax=Kordia sp. TaxID=1965332 RepID=UPI0025C40F2A|nr:hypothetical protein [Kordia sp.]MCH2196036.1 hypothetical protein [Kordia sp.]